MGKLQRQKQAHSYTHTHCGGCQSVRALLTTTAQCLLGLQTSAEPHRSQVYMPITDLCQESPPSLLPDHNKNWPSTPRAAPSKILPQEIFPPAPAQSKHLLSMELVGILGGSLFLSFSGLWEQDKTVYRNTGQGLAQAHKTARKQQAPEEERGEKCHKLPHTARGDVKPSVQGGLLLPEPVFLQV